MFCGYHGVSANVKQNRDTFATATQIQKISIQSQQKTWSISAETYETNARDFGISCPKYTLPSILQWHLNYEGPKLVLIDQDTFQYSLVLCPVPALTNVDLTPDPLGPHLVQAHVQSSVPPSTT